MCNHNPITLHEHGGETVVCANCGRVLKPWRARGESGSIGRTVIFAIIAISCSVFPAFATWLIVHKFSIELANLAAALVFLGAFGVVIQALCVCAVGGQDDIERGRK